jgi:hypothetical protein
MSEKQQPPCDIEVLRWDADSFTVEGMNLELENLRGQRTPSISEAVVLVTVGENLCCLSDRI